MVGTPNNTNWEAVLLAERESSVTAGERLIVGLLTGARISATMASVDNHVPVVGIVFVSTREDNRLRTLRLTSRDACLSRYVYPALVELGAVLEKAAFGIPGYMSKGAFGQLDTYRIALSKVWLLSIAITSIVLNGSTVG